MTPVTCATNILIAQQQLGLFSPEKGGQFTMPLRDDQLKDQHKSAVPRAFKETHERCDDTSAADSDEQSCQLTRPMVKCAQQASLLVSLSKTPAQSTTTASQLFSQLSAVFQHTRQTLDPGCKIDALHQPADSFQKMDALVQGLVRSYIASGSRDWEQYANFNEHHYVRNLIDANDDFELMVICWAPGQVSRVHDHASSHCWLTVLQGEVEEVQYKTGKKGGAHERSPVKNEPSIPGVVSVEGPCPKLDLVQQHTLTHGQTGYICDRIALHSVGCPEHVPAPGAVTLHLYSPPIRRATLYEPQENRVVQRIPGFFSVRGQRV